ncbi:MAG: LPXTG cell wall anchor domain-containing protein [Streptococcus parasanguinis]|uniref:beta-N-acetylhexosaminidase n=1 Tax=Streptococcus parasanguinis TaxID=1318 RepID=A0A943STU2_STRPA|nr:LPXTG cell wall anchor domain-containing protein [Streptococcus parasanguinis]
MKKIIYPSAALLAAFALLSVQTAKADTAQASDQANEPAATVEEVVASPTPETTTENQGGVVETPVATDREAVPAASPTETTTETASPQVEKLLEDMPLKQKVTQMIMPDFRKWQEAGQESPQDLTKVNAEVAEAIDKYDFGGVILFAENVKETKQTLALTQDMQKAAIENKANNGKIPLLLAIDQEGGIVYRLGSGTALPGNMAIGATNDPKLAKEAGQIIGRELSALGLNVDFAPVLDTNNNPQNPVIGLRSFSSDPNRVAYLGIPMMKGIQDYNVAVAAKHFPGHGDTAVDSHTGLPLVDKSLAELEKLELLPFKKAMDAGVDLLMTAHIQYPQIEKDQVVSKETGEKIYVPATLSDDILTGLVRKKYGYKGVIVSDAMGMDAIAKNFGEVEAVKMAIKAGVDLVLMPTTLRSKTDLSKIDTIVDEVVRAVQTGDISEERLNESVRRILTLKEKRGVLNFDPSARTPEKAEEAVGSTLNRDLERKIAAAAVTVVKNEDQTLPFKVQTGDHVLLLGAFENEVPGLNLGMRRLIADGVLPKDTSFVAKNFTKESTLDSLKEDLEKATHIVVISEIGYEGQLDKDFWRTKIPTEIVNYANTNHKKAAVLSISKPYDVANYPAAKAILAVYGNKGMDPTESLKPDNAFGPNIPAGVEVIFNGKEHVGTLPVDIPKIVDGKMSETEYAYRIGHGLFYPAPAPLPTPETQVPTPPVQDPTHHTKPVEVGHTGTQVLVSNQETVRPLDRPQVTPISVSQATDQAPVSVSASPASSVLPKTGQTENLLALMGVSLLTFLGSFVYPRKKN